MGVSGPFYNAGQFAGEEAAGEVAAMTSSSHGKFQPAPSVSLGW